MAEVYFVAITIRRGTRMFTGITTDIVKKISPKTELEQQGTAVLRIETA